LLNEIIESIPREEEGTTIFSRGDAWSVRLAQYSTISRAWKAALERHTFRTLTITTDELEAFAGLFSGENISRRAVLTTLTVEFILPNPANAMGCCQVTRTLDREADSAAFSTAVRKLFTILADLEARTVEKTLLSLMFRKGWRHSRSTEPWGGTRVPCTSKYGQRRHTRREVAEAKAMSGQFELLWEDSIPTVFGVTTLDFKGFDDLEDLKPTWIPVLVARLRDLEKLWIRRRDDYDDGRNKRHAQRNCMSSSEALLLVILTLRV